LFEKRGRDGNGFSYGLHRFSMVYIVFLFATDSRMFPILSSSSIRSLFQSLLRYRFDHSSNLLFVIDSFAVANLPFIIDSLTVAEVRYLIEDSQDEKREKVEEGTGTERIDRIKLNPKVAEDRRR
jgi:hypothetical protein